MSLLKGDTLEHTILTLLPDIKLRIDRDGLILQYIPSQREDPAKYGISSSSVGKFVNEIMHEPVAQIFLYNVRKAIAEERQTTFEYIIADDEQKDYFEARVVPLPSEEAAVILRDITQKRKPLLDLKRRISELSSINQELQQYIESDLQLENFAYIASHDLREPLRIIGNFAQLLANRYEHQLDTNGLSYLGFISQAAIRANRLIEDLATYSATLRQIKTIEPIDTAQLIQEVVNSQKDRIQQMAARINIANLPSIIACRSKIKLLFRHLIENALKFARPNTLPEICVEGTEREDSWLFKVSDNGIGIEVEFFDTIFLIFKRLNGRDDHDSTGIGLAICKKIVEQHRGKIWVESKADSGSTFHFTIKKGIH